MANYKSFEDGLNVLDKQINIVVQILKFLEREKCLFSDWEFISMVLNDVIQEQHHCNAGYFNGNNFIKYEGYQSCNSTDF